MASKCKVCTYLPIFLLDVEHLCGSTNCTTHTRTCSELNCFLPHNHSAYTHTVLTQRKPISQLPLYLFTYCTFTVLILYFFSSPKGGNPVAAIIYCCLPQFLHLTDSTARIQYNTASTNTVTAPVVSFRCVQCLHD